MTDLRARQKALARRTIAAAANELAAERRHLDFSLQEVADRAGVSLRTIYNHYPSREELLDGMLEHVNATFRELGGVLVDDITAFSDLDDAVARNFPIFEQTEPRPAAPAPGTPQDRDHARRTTRIAELVAAEVPELAPDLAAELGLLVRHLLSHTTWLKLTRDYGLTTPRATHLVRWAMGALVAAATRDGLVADDPLPSTTPAATTGAASSTEPNDPATTEAAG